MSTSTSHPVPAETRATMRAVGSRGPRPADDPESLIDFETLVPEPGEHDIRVRVEAVSANPVDTKRRSAATPEGDEPVVFGYDASGIVDAVGGAVTLFQPGDEVYYAGSVVRSGTNADFHLVDERIAAKKPASLSHAEAAALPLTTLTAWESLFDKLGATAETEGDLLIVGAAGGVGSMLIQLATQLTRLRVIATASRPETTEWVRSLGAHEVVDHHGDLAAQVRELAPDGVRFVFSPSTPGRLATYSELLATYGELVVIDGTGPDDDINVLKPKAQSLHWESMFTRSTFDAPDLVRQHEILARVAELVDAGTLRTTLTETVTGIDAATLRAAHTRLESGSTIGKLVLVRR